VDPETGEDLFDGDDVGIDGQLLASAQPFGDGLVVFLLGLRLAGASEIGSSG